jgi:hypothetical protein
MSKLLVWMGRVAGLLGLLLTAVAVVARLLGIWHIGSLSVGTLLMAGVAAMVAGTLAYAAALAESRLG